MMSALFWTDRALTRANFAFTVPPRDLKKSAVQLILIGLDLEAYNVDLHRVSEIRVYE